MALLKNYSIWLAVDYDGLEKERNNLEVTIPSNNLPGN